MIEITTNRHALRHTAVRAGVAVCLALVLTVVMTLGEFGTDLDATPKVKPWLGRVT